MSDLTEITDAAMDRNAVACAEAITADMRASGEPWGEYMSLVETVEGVTDEFVLEVVAEIKKLL